MREIAIRERERERARERWRDKYAMCQPEPAAILTYSDVVYAAQSLDTAS